MNWKKPIGILFAFAVVLGATPWWLSTKFLILAVKRAATVQADGAPVVAEVLDGTSTALVTMRESKGQPSYLLKFEGDTEWTGDTGSVLNCDEWVAPRMPILLISKHSPPCIKASPNGLPRRSLIRKNGFLQFVTDDQRTIRITGLRE
ncbi:MAG: hypothetical protein WA715_09550 [Candidatus Acidiferrum sp.]|jgi:hypothetical protein